jgi:hypothetical protein
MYKMFLKYSFHVVFVISIYEFMMTQGKARDFAPQNDFVSTFSFSAISRFFPGFACALKSQLNAHQILCTISELRRVSGFNCRQTFSILVRFLFGEENLGEEKRGKPKVFSGKSRGT